jgi:uracil phosphoribosyltransferase
MINPIANRKYSDFVNLSIKEKLSLLADRDTNSTIYRDTMFQLGRFMGEELAKELSLDEKYCVVSTVEDADFLTKGVIEGLDKNLVTVSLVCFWNDRSTINGNNISPIYNKFIENGTEKTTSMIVVKSIMSGSCVVKTNITALFDSIQPKHIHVLAPVMHKDSKAKLEKEFPDSIGKKFSYLSLAIDEQKTESGEVIPGIGGSVYERLGFSGQAEKNTYIPKVVTERLFASL